MEPKQEILASETIQMLVASMTHQGSSPISELEVERFLNALTRLQSHTPTGVNPSHP